MNTSLFIAYRYLVSKKKNNFANVISKLSIIGVIIGTMSLVFVLSIFNGLEDVLRSIYGNFEPQLKIAAAKGKSFEVDNKIYDKIKSVDGVEVVAKVIEDNVLVKYGNNQAVVKLKGVSEEFGNIYGLKNFVTEGKPLLIEYSTPRAIIGRGIQYRLGVDLKNFFYSLSFWYPKNDTKWGAASENLFNNLLIHPSGVFSLEKQYDDLYIFVPLEFAQDLMQYQNKLTSLELKLRKGVNDLSIKKQLEKVLGAAYTVKTRDEQHESLLKAIKIEKLFVYFTFTFVIGILSLNIFFSLTMLAIEKRKTIKQLYCMGATLPQVRNIFLFNGVLSGLIGSVLGLILGYLLCLAQQKYGFINVGETSTLLSAYPIKIVYTDFVIAWFIVVSVVTLVSLQPAIKAAKSIN